MGYRAGNPRHDVATLSKETGSILWPETFKGTVAGQSVTSVTASIEVVKGQVCIIPRVVHLARDADDVGLTESCSYSLRRSVLAGKVE